MTSNDKPVVGLIVMETMEAPAGSSNPFLIHTLYSEFDSGTWLQNLAAAGICGPSASVVGAPAPASAAPVAAPTASSHASSPSSMAAVVPINGSKIYEAPGPRA